MLDADNHNQKDELKLKVELHAMTWKVGVKKTKNKWQATKGLKGKKSSKQAK